MNNEIKYQSNTSLQQSIILLFNTIITNINDKGLKENDKTKAIPISI